MTSKKTKLALNHKCLAPIWPCYCTSIYTIRAIGEGRARGAIAPPVLLGIWPISTKFNPKNIQLWVIISDSPPSLYVAPSVCYKLQRPWQWLNTVPAPLKGTPYIQELFFGPLHYHMKIHKIWVLAWFFRGEATNRKRPLMARVRYVIVCPSVGGLLRGYIANFYCPVTVKLQCLYFL